MRDLGVSFFEPVQASDRAEYRADVVLEPRNGLGRRDHSMTTVHTVDLGLLGQFDRRIIRGNAGVAAGSTLGLTNQYVRLGFPGQEIQSDETAEEAWVVDGPNRESFHFSGQHGGCSQCDRWGRCWHHREVVLGSANSLQVALHLSVTCEPLPEALPATSRTGFEQRSKPQFSPNR